MRRVLLVALLLAAPAALAQTSGQIRFVEGEDDIVRGPWISRAECEDPSATVTLDWNTQLVDVTSFPADASYFVYASNKQAQDTTCITEPDSNANTFAAQIGTEITGEDQFVTNRSFVIADLLQARGTTSCDVTGEVPVYVCIQAKQGDTIVGVAKGTIKLQVTPPGTPQNLAAIPADDAALKLTWDPPAGDPRAYDYRIEATATGQPTVGATTGPSAQSHVIEGLALDVPYTIRVWARSEAGNESETPAETSGTPVPVSDFWDVYTAAGGREQGGCASGSAGSLAILGLAGLLAALRRRS